MRQLTRTLLTLFAAVLALWLVVGFWPISTISRSVLSVCILLVCGAALSFELRPGTADGIMETRLVIDSQKLTYMNQMPAWKRFTWPADTEAPGAALSWISTQAGTRQYADMSGAWGWIRLLDKASVSAYPGTGSSYSLTWQAQDGRPLNYTLRTEAGEGPLALLKLRNFSLPLQIFTVSEPAAAPLADDTDPTEETY